MCGEVKVGIIATAWQLMISSWVVREDPGEPAEDSEDKAGSAIERAAVELVFEPSVDPTTSANAALSAAASASLRRHGIIRCLRIHCTSDLGTAVLVACLTHKDCLEFSLLLVSNMKLWCSGACAS